MIAAGNRSHDRAFARAFAGSVGVHALFVALVFTLPSYSLPRWAPLSSMLIDVELAEPTLAQLRGSTMPAVSDALAAPNVMQDVTGPVSSAPAAVRERVHVRSQQRDRAPEAESVPPPADESARAVTNEASADSDAPTVAVAAPPEPIDRCGDPINGVWNGRAWLADYGRGGLWFEVRLTLRRDGEGAEGSAQMRELWPRSERSPREWRDVTCAEFGGVFSVTTDAHGRRMTEPGAPDGEWDVLTGYYEPEDMVSACGRPGFRGPRRRQIVMRVDGSDRAEGRAPSSFTLTRIACAP